MENNELPTASMQIGPGRETTAGTTGVLGVTARLICIHLPVPKSL